VEVLGQRGDAGDGEELEEVVLGRLAAGAGAPQNSFQLGRGHGC
jgi:hypothetical protein